jgi:two-component system phosphate regulon response regulator PhoB/two-component system alkaline phosphatase synthesis response regulator PhoP
METPSKKPLIVAIDDEPDILQLITVHLEKSGFLVKTFLKAGPFFTFIEKGIPDLIILDLMLPDFDGLEVCKSLKNDPRWADIPVLMLTAKGDETDIVLGLELGADDYMVKPFSPKELLARIKAILRRGKVIRPERSEEIIIEDDLVINLSRHEVYVHDQKVELTRTEFTILRIMAEKPGWVFSREKLLIKLWGDDKYVIDRTIDVHIKNLRDKLGKLGSWIKNVRGVGYKLEP